jgi:hypothetical protein
MLLLASAVSPSTPRTDNTISSKSPKLAYKGRLYQQNEKIGNYSNYTIYKFSKLDNIFHLSRKL